MELTFEVISNPIPRDWGVWLTRLTTNSSEAANVNIKPMTNFTCKVDVQTRYLSRCVLTIFIIPSDIPAGSLKVQIINEVGDENFTVEIRHVDLLSVDDPKGSRTNMAAVAGGVIGVILFISAVVIIVVVIKRRKKGKAPFIIRGLGDGWCRTSASTRSSGTEVNKDRWTNQDGLTYMSLRFDNRRQFPAPKHEATEYSTIKQVYST
ncbi:uncharacterized protein LOC112568628 [Pomacea canaliculata]|uniref:uncharacterized protein LOC112568628 n=1 Tax=Pomacea canaliculata TaxID=400727 RepID=UPI000D731C97|nr:uncharacterized protein LOC112568628 [Pomacea canaliculata]